MARFGYLYLNNGEWDGEQVVPKSWVVDSISPHTLGYGYQWWLRELKGVSVFSADGQGGNHIICVLQKDLVVVVASKPRARWREPWSLIEDIVIPAVVE
jgi:CubicO group peptidase (beta-lactamase class C family)